MTLKRETKEKFYDLGSGFKACSYEIGGISETGNRQYFDSTIAVPSAYQVDLEFVVSSIHNLLERKMGNTPLKTSGAACLLAMVDDDNVTIASVGCSEAFGPSAYVFKKDPASGSEVITDRLGHKQVENANLQQQLSGAFGNLDSSVEPKATSEIYSAKLSFDGVMQHGFLSIATESVHQGKGVAPLSVLLRTDFHDLTIPEAKDVSQILAEGAEDLYSREGPITVITTKLRPVQPPRHIMAVAKGFGVEGERVAKAVTDIIADLIPGSP